MIVDCGASGSIPSNSTTHQFRKLAKIDVVEWIPFQRLFKLLLDIEKVGYFNSTW